MALRSHVLAAARFGPYAVDERTYATELWSMLPDDSLTLVDRLFLAAKPLMAIVRGGRNRHWLTRARSVSKWTRTQRLAPGDELVEMTVSRLPERILKLRQDISYSILPERRDRSYPREVKIKMSNYPRKRPSTRRRAK